MTLEAVPLAAAIGVNTTEAPGERLGHLFDAHHARLYRLARRLTSTADDAKDLVQETFLRAARSPGAVPEGTTSEEAWLVRVLINLCRDTWRRRGTHQRADERGYLNTAIASPSSQEDILIARTTVWRGLRALPPRQRAVLVLHELDELAVPEVARLLGIAAVTVRWQLSAGRRALARAIKKENDHE